MATSTRWASGTSLIWYGAELEEALHDDAVDRLYQAGDYLTQKVRDAMAASQPPSKPGSAPAIRMGGLENSVNYTVNYNTLELIVGSHSPVALYMEYGRPGGKTIYAQPGSVFAWIDAKTQQVVFAKKVTLGPIAPRPIFRRLLYNEARALANILGKATLGFGIRGLSAGPATPSNVVPLGVVAGTP